MVLKFIASDFGGQMHNDRIFFA